MVAVVKLHALTPTQLPYVRAVFLCYLVPTGDVSLTLVYHPFYRKNLFLSHAGGWRGILFDENNQDAPPLRAWIGHYNKAV